MIIALGTSIRALNTVRRRLTVNAANPIGGAVGHLIAPVYTDIRQGVRALAL